MVVSVNLFAVEVTNQGVQVCMELAKYFCRQQFSIKKSPLANICEQAMEKD